MKLKPLKFLLLCLLNHTVSSRWTMFEANGWNTFTERCFSICSILFWLYQKGDSNPLKNFHGCRRSRKRSLKAPMFGHATGHVSSRRCVQMARYCRWWVDGSFFKWNPTIQEPLMQPEKKKEIPPFTAWEVDNNTGDNGFAQLCGDVTPCKSGQKTYHLAVFFRCQLWNEHLSLSIGFVCFFWQAGRDLRPHRFCWSQDIDIANHVLAIILETTCRLSLFMWWVGFQRNGGFVWTPVIYPFIIVPIQWS